MGTLRIHVVPNAMVDKVVGEHGGAIKIKLRAPAAKGKANAALITFLAQTLAISQQQITLESGKKSRRKLIRVEGLDPQMIKDRLLSEL